MLSDQCVDVSLQSVAFCLNRRKAPPEARLSLQGPPVLLQPQDRLGAHVLVDPGSGERRVRRGWSRLFGRAPNALLYALVVVVRNVRLVLAAEDREDDAARRAAMGLSPLTRRRRRRRHPESVPSELVASVPDPAPG